MSYRFRTHGMGFAEIEQGRNLSFSKGKPNLPRKDSSRPEIEGRFILVYRVKSPFTLIVIPGLTRNPVFSLWAIGPSGPEAIWIPAFAGMTASELM
jgi:hypothetical protein